MNNVNDYFILFLVLIFYFFVHYFSVGFLIQQGYGRDASALYESTHPESARAVMNKFYIGIVLF